MNTGVPQLDSLENLQTFLAQSGFDICNNRVWAEHFNLPAHYDTQLGETRIIAQTGNPNKPPFMIFHVPRATMTKDLLSRIRTTLEQRARDALFCCTNDWQTLTLYLLLQEDQRNQRNDIPTWTITVQDLRPNDIQALHMLAIHNVSRFELDWHIRRAFSRAERETLYTNQGFFSNYYLLERLEQDYPAWQTLATDMETLRPTVEHIIQQTPLCTSASSVVNTTTKADTEQHLVRPLLEALGWQIHTPQNKDAYYDLDLQIDGTHVAMCNIVTAGQPLDLPGYTQQTANNAQDADLSSPDMRMIAALKHGQPHGRIWGIITNGMVWRLIGSIASSASGVYYEVDVRDILNAGQTKDLRFFAAFFGPTGLAKPTPDTDALITHIYHSGQHHAKAIGENLKTTIFTHTFVDLATGLSEAMRRTGRNADSEEELHLLYRATLILLYRLLFLLYAESRHLLPTTHSAYYPHSLSNLLKHIALNRNHLTSPDQRKPIGPLDAWIWEHLQALFNAIDTGKPTWGIPRYNGGLFSDTATDAHALLANLTDVGAAYLAPALDSLARDRTAQAADTTNDALRFIDYMALDVRRLGSIYEGLLEFQLRRATSTMVLHKGQWEAIPDGGKAKAQQPTTNTGQLYLENTRQERKASGSYYTPDYIVQYIVEHAVGPVFEQRKRLFADKLNRLRTKRTARRRTHNSATAQLLDREIETLERETSDALLDLKILDPAMGSGHFLVSTVDYLSDHIIAVLEHYPNDNPIYPQLARIRQSIKESMHTQGIADTFITDEQLTNRNLLRRMVMKRCVYGVDLNDLAVELARLSLWLHSFTVGAPLSFLDHHLKCGNSLIGAYNIEDVIAPNSSRWNQFMLALSNMVRIAQLTDSTPEELQLSYNLYADSRKHVQAIIERLNVGVAGHYLSSILRYGNYFLLLHMLTYMPKPSALLQ